MAHNLFKTALASLGAVLCFIMAPESGARTDNRLFEDLFAACPERDSLFRAGSASSWLPYPAWSDREGWEGMVPARTRQELIAKGESLLDYEWQTLYASDYLEYERTGDRAIMKKESGNRSVLNALIVAELAEGKGRFLPKIADGMWFETQRHSWDHAQHTTRQSSRRTLPGYDEKFITLHSANNAATLAAGLYFFKEELDKMEPTICRTVYRALEEHTFKPFIDESLDAGPHAFFGFTDKGQIINNWDPYCCLYTTFAFLLADRDQERLDRAMSRSFRAMDAYLSYITQDGACDEGPSYWRMAFGKVYEYARFISDATHGRINALPDPFLLRMGEFKMKTDLGDDWVMNYGDAGARSKNDVTMLIWRFADGIGSQPLKDYALTKMIDRKSWKFKDITIGCSEIFTALEDLRFEKAVQESGRDVQKRYGRELAAFIGDTEKAIGPQWYPETQQAVLRNGNGWVLAAKGGHNNESHNHNDTGSGMLFIDGIPVIVDPGTGTYVKDTFGPNRYSIWYMGSYWHNVPVVSHGQLAGPAYGASRCECDAEAGTFTTEFSAAYGPDTGCSLLERRWTLEKDRLVLSDSYVFTSRKVAHIGENFVTTGKVFTAGDVAGGRKLKKNEVVIETKSFDKRRTMSVLVNIPSGWRAIVMSEEMKDERLSRIWGPWLSRIIISPPAKSAPKGVFTAEFTRL